MATIQKQPIGATRISKNGYHYTKVDEGNWRLTHHIIAEQKLGRTINKETERVKFIDKDRTNLSPDNIAVVQKGSSSTEKILARLYAARDEIQAKINELEALNSRV